MRIISGVSRGRKLLCHDDCGIRPTRDYVKESVFNIISFDIEGRNFLDLFAGTGQIGIEAISRGAVSAVFVDNSKEAVRLIGDNLSLCGFSEYATVRLCDAISFIDTCDKFDLIYLDPPYNDILLSSALHKIAEFDKLCKNGIIIAESSASTQAVSLNSPYYLAREYTYGSTKISKYSRR